MTHRLRRAVARLGVATLLGSGLVALAPATEADATTLTFRNSCYSNRTVWVTNRYTGNEDFVPPCGKALIKVSHIMVPGGCSLKWRGAWRVSENHSDLIRYRIPYWHVYGTARLEGRGC